MPSLTDLVRGTSRWPGDASEDKPGRGVLSFRPTLSRVRGGVGGGVIPRRRTAQGSQNDFRLVLECPLVDVV